VQTRAESLAVAAGLQAQTMAVGLQAQTMAVGLQAQTMAVGAGQVAVINVVSPPNGAALVDRFDPHT
jgi:hypothetical protein